MPSILLLPFALLIIPVVEIGVLIFMGKEIGLLWTIFLILFTATLGIIILRTEGFLTFIQVREKIDSGKMPGEELLKAVTILIAGILLLTPGFITDIVGLVLFFPFTRKLAWRFLISWFAGKVVNVTISGHNDDFAGESTNLEDSDIVELYPEDFCENYGSGKS